MKRLFSLVLWSLLAAVVAGGAAQAADARPYNVLFLMTDQHHAGALGCAGHGIVKSPNLDRLAAGGTRLTNAFCPVPYCSPTRAAIVTGLYPSTLGLGRNIDAKDDPLRLREPRQTYLHQLAARGYRCHQLGKWHLGDPGELSCFPENAADEKAFRALIAERRKAAGDQQFDAGPRPGEVELVGNVYLTAHQSKAHQEYLQEKHRPKQDVGVIGRSRLKPEFQHESILADYCIELLKRHRDEPFAITYSVSPPHAPFVSPAPYYDMYDPAQLPLPASWNDRPKLWETSVAARLGAIFGEEGFREYMRCYYGEITRMDDCIGRILKALDELKLADRTLVVFTSDHGNMLGGHGMMEKGHGDFYDDLVRVPLLVRLPGVIPAGKTCAQPASLVDLAPTILDYLGAAPLAQCHGKSLRPWLDGAPPEERPIFAERAQPDTPACSRMIRTEQWKLCLLPRGEIELFDLAADPGELRNVADAPANAAVLAELKKKLLAHMRQVSDPAVKSLGPRLQ